jgi:hypothetical protein
MLTLLVIIAALILIALVFGARAAKIVLAAILFPISLAFTVLFFWLLIATQAPAADGHAIIHKDPTIEPADEETAVDASQAVDFNDFLIDRKSFAAGEVVILSGSLTYHGEGTAYLRKGEGSYQSIPVFTEHFPRSLRKDMLDLCDDHCRVDIKAQVVRGGGLLPIDMDIYSYGSNVPRGFFW